MPEDFLHVLLTSFTHDARAAENVASTDRVALHEFASNLFVIVTEIVGMQYSKELAGESSRKHCVKLGANKDRFSFHNFFQSFSNFHQL